MIQKGLALEEKPSLLKEAQALLREEPEIGLKPPGFPPELEALLGRIYSQPAMLKPSLEQQYQLLDSGLTAMRRRHEGAGGCDCGQQGTLLECFTKRMFTWYAKTFTLYSGDITDAELHALAKACVKRSDFLQQ
jgi:hypothetical protein